MRDKTERPEFEAVHFVEGFAEGELNGTADYAGTPHHFVLRSAEPNQAEVYLLTPLSPEVFGAVKEAWEIWRRWQRAQTETPNEASALRPALPEDRERQAELRGFVSNWLSASKSLAFLAEGDFEQAPSGTGSDADAQRLRVKWQKLALPPGHLTTE